MKRLKILGAAALVASAFATPAMAQAVISNPGYCAQFYPNANCQNTGPANPYTGGYQYRQAYGPNRAWRDSYNRWNDPGGFGPGNVAAGVVGGAVGAAGAIATAPFRADSYAQRNGFVCTPGTWFRGEDGRRHICQ